MLVIIDFGKISLLALLLVFQVIFFFIGGMMGAVGMKRNNYLISTDEKQIQVISKN